MADLPLNPSIEQIEDELAFQNVLRSSLDPGDESYQDKLQDIEATTQHLEQMLHSLLPDKSNWNHPHQMAGAPFPGHQGSQTASAGKQPISLGSSSSSTPNSSSASTSSTNHRYDYASLPPVSGVKRPHLPSSLGSYEHPTKRLTPEPSNPTTPSSVDSLGYFDRDAAERARVRQQAAEAALKKQYEARLKDAALARQISAEHGGSPHAFLPPQSSSSSKLNGVQTTLNHNGGYLRPPPPQLKSEPTKFEPVQRPHTNFAVRPPPASGTTVKPDPRLPQQQLVERPRVQPMVVDLTGSDSDNDVSETAAAVLPSSRDPGLSRSRFIENAVDRSLPPMPGAWPSPDPRGQYVYGSPAGMSSAPRYPVSDPRFAPAQNVLNPLRFNGGFSNALQRFGSNLFGSSFSQPFDVDSDEDDDIIYAGIRQLSGYAGNEDLYRSRYDTLAAYDPTKSREEIQALLANIRPDEEMPAHLRAQTPEAMSIRLHKYQELGLTWLQQCEKGSNKGGILADDMGLGKTIQMLALIVTHKSEDPRCKTTLIVAPVALMRQWKQEIQQKIKTGSHALTVFTHHGAIKAKDFRQLQHYDIVLTTYGSLASELKKKETFHMRQAANPSALETASEKCVLISNDAKWYRVILDEAQCIKNRSTQTSRGACHLNAQYRFCVTGTPMMNNVEELYSLIRFLRIKPYDKWEKFRLDFKSNLTSPNESHREKSMQMLQALCKAIMLRRTKKSTFEGKPILVLPERSTTVDSPVFNDDERQFYEALEGRTRLEFNKYLRRGTVGKSYSVILVLLLRLRQACCHPHLIKDFGVSAASDLSSDQLIEFAKKLDESVVNRIKEMNSSFECPVCYDSTPNPAIFIPCGHVSCSECFARIADAATAAQGGEDDTGNVKCPNCRAAINPKRLTDFTSFKKVYMPELLTETEMQEMGVVESESGDSDSGDDVDDTDEADDDGDDESETESLNGFIAKDDEIDEEGDDNNIRRSFFDPFKVKTESPLEASTPTVEEGVAAGPSTAKHNKPSKKSKGRKAKTSKGKGKEKKKQKPAVTLAELKKLATRNAKAKRAYLRQLRKGWVSSAKIDKTLEILKTIMDDPNDKEKVLIFSQWTSLLDLLEIPIDEAGYGYRRYDGSMNAKMRGDAVDDFRDAHKDVRVMLVSLKAGNAGLNLNMASQVIILDPFWNPYIEEQAIDRAHRIGQTRPVKVHRVLIEKTVEDRILELQEKKRALISEALDEQQHSAIARLGVQELAYLFGVTNNLSQRVDYVPRDRR